MQTIPYAIEVMKSGVVSTVCPCCSEHIPLVTRKDFESFSTQPYADHWTAEHSDVQTEGFSYPDGYWDLI